MSSPLDIKKSAYQTMGETDRDRPSLHKNTYNVDIGKANEHPHAQPTRI